MIPVAPPRTHAPRHPRDRAVDGYPDTTARWTRHEGALGVRVTAPEGASVYTPAALEAGARSGSRWSEAVLRAVTR